METYMLSNGLRVVSESIPNFRSVALGIWVKTGSRNESEANNGISHFIEHMLFKGTDRYSAKDIAEIFDEIGGNINAFTAKEYTCYYTKVLDEHLPVALEVLASMLFHSVLDEVELEKEKNVILEEISMYEDTPDDLVHDLAAKAAFGNHPLGYSILGIPDRLRAFAPKDLKAYMDVQYTIDNMVISVAGKIDERCAVWLETYFGGQRINGERDACQPPRFVGESIFHYKKTEQNHICLTYPGCSQKHEDIYAMILLNNVIGGGMSSRLFQEIRENRGLAYSVYSYHSAHLDSGLFTIYIGSAPKQTDEVLKVTMELLDGLLHHGLTETELQKSKQQMKGNLILSLESTSSRMNRLGKNEITLGEHPSIEDALNRIEQVRLADIRRVVESVLRQPISMAVVGPNEPDFDNYGGNRIELSRTN